MSKYTLTQLEQHEEFIRRHIGPDAGEQAEMLACVGAASLDELTERIVPPAIRLPAPLSVGLLQRS